MEESSQHGFWGTTSEEILRNNFPLHRACRDGDWEALSLLLIEAQHGIYVEDSFYGWTPAHWAAYFGKLGCLTKLMENSANCDTATIRLNQTPSHLAAFAGNTHCLKWLLHIGAFMERQDYLGETPVHKAARTGSMECVSLLTSHSARLYIQNKNGQTPAQLASACGHMDCSHFLENMAARQQDTLPMGVYKTLTPPSNTTLPSPHDVTTKKTHPCVIKAGLNGGRLPPQPPTLTVSPFEGSVHHGGGGDMFNGGGMAESASAHVPDCHGDHNELSEMVAMEQEALETMQEPLEMIAGSINGFHSHSNGVVFNKMRNGDITLQKGVSLNRIPIAGKKRGREDSDEVEHKRMRKNGDIDASFTTNGYYNNHHHSPLPVKQSLAMAAMMTNQIPSHGMVTQCFTPFNNNASTLYDHHDKSDMFGLSRSRVGDVVDYGDVISDTALEHCSSVLLELGYGDMVSEFHGL